MIGSFVYINIDMEQEREIGLSQKRIINTQAPRLWYPGTKTLVPPHIWQGTLSLVGHQSRGARAP